MISKAENKDTLKLLPYTQVENDKLAGLKVFGDHNRSNLNGALIACLELGISEVDFGIVLLILKEQIKTPKTL